MKLEIFQLKSFAICLIETWQFSFASQSKIEQKSLKKKEQRERRKRLRERSEKEKMVDKMVGLLEVDQEEDNLVVKDPMSK